MRSAVYARAAPELRTPIANVSHCRARRRSWCSAWPRLPGSGARDGHARGGASHRALRTCGANGWMAPLVTVQPLLTIHENGTHWHIHLRSALCIHAVISLYNLLHSYQPWRWAAHCPTLSCHATNVVRVPRCARLACGASTARERGAHEPGRAARVPSCLYSV